MSGLTFTSGLAGHPPAGWGFSYMDHMGANFMALAVLAALVHRNRTGEGQWVDLAMTEVGLTLTGPALLDATLHDRPMRRPAYRTATTATRRRWRPTVCTRRTARTAGWRSPVATMPIGSRSPR